MLALMDRNRNTIEVDITTLVFYMNGGLDYNSAWMLTFDQRRKMANVIEKHNEAMSGEKKNML